MGDFTIGLTFFVGTILIYTILDRLNTTDTETVTFEQCSDFQRHVPTTHFSLGNLNRIKFTYQDTPVEITVNKLHVTYKIVTPEGETVSQELVNNPLYHFHKMGQGKTTVKIEKGIARKPLPFVKPKTTAYVTVTLIGRPILETDPDRQRQRWEQWRKHNDTLITTTQEVKSSL